MPRLATCLWQNAIQSCRQAGAVDFRALAAHNDSLSGTVGRSTPSLRPCASRRHIPEHAAFKGPSNLAQLCPSEAACSHGIAAAGLLTPAGLTRPAFITAAASALHTPFHHNTVPWGILPVAARFFQHYHPHQTQHHHHRHEQQQQPFSCRAYSSTTQQISPLQQQQQPHIPSDSLIDDIAGSSRPAGSQINPLGTPRPQFTRDPSKGPPMGICRRKNIRIGWKKLHFVLRMIRRAHVDDALAQLAVNPKKGAMYARAAVANAKNNAIMQGANPEKLIVDQAFVNKGQYIKYAWIMGRGHNSVKEHQHTHLTVVVKEDPNISPWTKFLPQYIAPRRSKGPAAAAAAAGSDGGQSSAGAATTRVHQVRRRSMGKRTHKTRSVSRNRVRMK